MSIRKKIINFLEKTGIKYETIEHKTVYTASDKAATLRVKPETVAKTLVLKTDREMVTAVIPANRNLDKNKFKKTVNSFRKKKGDRAVTKIDFVSEKVMKNKFKGIKIGAIPPFGNLWNMVTFVEAHLMKKSKIIVNSGDYNYSLKIKPSDFKKLIPYNKLSQSLLIIDSFGKVKK